MAVVTDEPVDVDVPQFSRDEVQGLADLIETKLQAQLEGEDIQLFANGALIPINPFLRSLLAKVLVAIASSLKGIEEIRNLHITLRRQS